MTEGSGEVLTCLASKLREEKEGEVVGEEGKEDRLERTGKPVVSKLTHSESAPDIFFHEASKKMSGAPKGILRPPGSPRQRRPKSIFRLTSIPTEVLTILIRQSSRFGKNCVSFRFGRLRIAWWRGSSSARRRRKGKKAA